MIRRAQLNTKQGFTFIELMVTLAILSVGLVAIFRSFFVCLNYIDHLSHRLNAVILLENRLADIEKNYRRFNHFNFSPGPEEETIPINNKEVLFTYGALIEPFDEVPGLHTVRVSLKWKEREKDYSLSKTAYFSDVVSTVAP